MVLITDENTPQKNWLMGRIIQTFPGMDGLVRGARLKTSWTDPDQAHNQVMPFGIYRRRDVNLYALCETLYTGLVLSRNTN